MASYRGRNVTLSFSRDEGQTWERLSSEAVEIQISVDRASLQQLDASVVQAAITRLRDRTNWQPIFASFSGLALASSTLTGALAEFGRSAVEAAAQAEREYQRLRPGEWQITNEPCDCSICQHSHEETEAEARARDLLLSCLTPAQQEEYTVSRFFTIKVKSGNCYRIEPHRNYNVISLDEKGWVVSKLCAGPVEDVPIEDQMLAQKLLLETDEAGFLAVANRQVLTTSSFSGALP